MSLSSLQIDQVSYREIAIQFFFGFSTGIILESSAIIQFIEDYDPTGNQIHLFNSDQLLALLLTFRKGFIGGEFVDILEHQLLLFGQEIFQDPIYFLAEQDRILFFIVVKNSKKPAHMILDHGLVKYFLAVASNSKRMLKGGFLTIFSKFILKYLFVKFDGSRDCVMVSEVRPIFLVHLLLLHSTQHCYISYTNKLLINIISRIQGPSLVVIQMHRPEKSATLYYQLMRSEKTLKIKLIHSYKIKDPPFLRKGMAYSTRLQQKTPENKYSDAYLQRQQTTNKIYSSFKSKNKQHLTNKSQSLGVKTKISTSASPRILQQNLLPQKSKPYPLNLYISQQHGGSQKQRQNLYSSQSATRCTFKRSHSARVFQKYPMFEQMTKIKEEKRQQQIGAKKIKMIASDVFQRKLQLGGETVERKIMKRNLQGSRGKIYIYEKGIVLGGR